MADRRRISKLLSLMLRHRPDEFGLNVDEYGLDDMDARILTMIIEKFGGGPVGLNTIAVAVGEDPGTIEDVYEPFLLRAGYIEKTPRGRRATKKALEHVGAAAPAQPELF